MSASSPAVGGLACPPPGGRSQTAARAPRDRGHGRRERGGVTAELAIVLPGIVLLLLALLTAASAALTQVRVADAARAGARAVALGEPPAVIIDMTARLAGEGASVRVASDGPFVVVEVACDLLGPLRLTDLVARATARAVPEPGAP
ncbi:TadE family type IV pilus minor pilin [Georgenia yuyongxinii]|uniref:Pilus assembly protein TadE n=1 Tax=Georgenia yuyongxinii TaxID=2589797 RepID=A0A552WKG7_9MICO|nr:TadE family type IV pilus minor pilin [Georgenia yuyongxinii]TRW43174.1 pilus assembly protein TadE [Georgenia yuyongxinii]